MTQNNNSDKRAHEFTSGGALFSCFFICAKFREEVAAECERLIFQWRAVATSGAVNFMVFVCVCKAARWKSSLPKKAIFCIYKCGSGGSKHVFQLKYSRAVFAEFFIAASATFFKGLLKMHPKLTSFSSINIERLCEWRRLTCSGSCGHLMSPYAGPLILKAAFISSRSKIDHETTICPNFCSIVSLNGCNKNESQVNGSISAKSWSKMMILT